MRKQTIGLPHFSIALLCLLVASGSANALDPTKSITQYVHSTWHTDEGLPENSVTKILETADGYLWVGTQAGLARFDGVHFTTFDHTNSPELHNDWITDLAEGRDGTLWIATASGGVTSFRHGVFSHLKGIGERAARTLAADADGSIWIGGYGGLMHLRDGSVLRTWSTANGLSGDPVTHIAIDNDRSVWITTSTGLNHLLSDGSIEEFTRKNGLPGNDVTNLFLDANGTLLVKTQNSGLLRRSHDRFEPWSIAGTPDATVSDMLKDRDGNVWFGSSTTGIRRVSRGQLQQFKAKDGLASNQVNTLYEDRDGNIWVGTNEGGLERFRDGSFTTYAKEEGLADDRTFSVLEDSLGNIWVTTGAGLSRLHHNQVRVFTTADGLPANDGWALWEDHHQDVWVGAASSGPFRMSHGRFVPALPSRNQIPPYEISAIKDDSAGRLWFLSRGGGLASYVDGQVNRYSRSNGLLTNFLYVMAQGADGTIWLGTSGGLNSFRNGHVDDSGTRNPLLHSGVPSLYFDNENILWIGTLGRGLFRMENGRFVQYTTRQGLPDDTINGIVEDADSNLWLSSNKGIFRISRADLDAVSAGVRNSVEATLFGRGDGMKSSETNAGTQPSAWRARDGRLWFPTIRGVVVVDPAHVSLSSHQPVARVERVFADDVAFNPSASMRFAPGTRRVQIQYTAPSLSAPERTRFRHRLDGFDEKWVTGSEQRTAQYTNLPPGHYTFHVSASAETGSWGAQEGTIQFDLPPRFFQTWWFKLLYIAAGLVALWGIYRLRVNWLHSKAAVLEERQRIAGEIHDSLAQGLSGIIFQTELALIDMPPGIASKRVTSARDLAKTSLDEARYSVWNLSPPVLEQVNLPDALSSMARQMTFGRVDQLDVHASGNAWTMRPEANHHVVLIAQEAISNSIQHGKARRISVELTYAANALNLFVSDDGIGLPAAPAARDPERGYGLQNMHHRAERLGGKLHVTSEGGGGTRISLRVPRVGMMGRFWRRLTGQGIARIEE